MIGLVPLSGGGWGRQEIPTEGVDEIEFALHRSDPPLILSPILTDEKETSMIERDEQVGAMVFRCDHCTNTSDDYNLDDFQAAVDDIKESGWKVRRDERAEGGWSHVCPDHSGAGRVAEHRRLLGM